jgi:large subunit ribosomal protein L7A
MMVDKDYPKIVGVKQTVKEMNSDNIKYVCVAKDADPKIIRPVIEKAEKQGLEILYFETMIQLGKTCDIDVGAAAALFLNK